MRSMPSKRQLRAQMMKIESENEDSYEYEVNEKIRQQPEWWELLAFR